MQKVELKDIRNFVLIARAGSLTRATMVSGVPKATLSHSIRRLEDLLEVELFLRSQRGFHLTDAGNALLDNSARVFDSIEAATSAAQRAHSSLNGKVRILGSTEFGTSIIGAATLLLAREHPGLSFETRTYPGDTPLPEPSDFDCLIFVGTAPSSDHVCRKLGNVSYRAYASPILLEKWSTPERIDDLSRMPGIEYTRKGIAEPWLLQDDDGKQAARYDIRFSVHDYWMAKFYAVSGEAVAYLPDFFVYYEVAQGSLVPLLKPPEDVDQISVWVIYGAARHKNPRVKLVVDTLCKQFSSVIHHPGYALVRRTD
ncbi:LysR family transcriptional regulator [Paracoccus onubensis]|uniref:LysR family transcriptional regulator n=1 Tax=Paracoccus onubensis TaxID=1675788 RepID=UPI00272FE483|nr:LysR family transcriptional regulator [Paracoccus onubensis]MDP0926506.1 LysR family transcriptional regulator [Paracoccus onubensis]